MKALTVFCFSIYCASLSLNAYGQDSKTRFEHLTIQQGLSQNNVLCMIQDSKGFLWFGTYGGLNRYDGYTFKVYQFDPSDTASLSQNLIMALYEDQEGMIWVGTAGMGMCKFNPETEKFTRYPEQPVVSGGLHHRTVCALNEDREGSLWLGTFKGVSSFDKKTEKFTRFKYNAYDTGSISTDEAITDIYKDKEGTLWIGTEQHGLNKMIITSEDSGKSSEVRFVHYQHDANHASSLSSNRVTAICEDRQGMLWVGTVHGLNRLNKKTGQWKHYRHDPHDPYSLSSNQINMDALLEDNLGNLWIGTNNGLNKLNRDRTKFTSYRHDPDDENSLSSNDIRSLLLDRSGILWIGTIGGGINKLDPHKRHFTLLKHDPENANSISHSAVSAIFEDKDGIVWIGTEGGGLNKYNPVTGRITNYKHDPNDQNSISSNLIGAILEDSRGNLWVGGSSSSYDFTSGAGMNKFDKTNGKFIHFLNSTDDFLSTDVYTLYEDKQGVLWIGTENGIVSYDQASGNMVHYPHDPGKPDGISDLWVYAILEDSKGTLWIGTGSGGLSKLDRNTGIFTHYKYDPHDQESISSNAIRAIFEDRNGNLWIGTSFGGLCYFDKETETFTTYMKKDGLPDNAVYGILEDEEGNLWLSTNKGICRFSPSTVTFTNFDHSDGLQGNQFATGYVNSGACFKGKDGTLYFGGNSGMNIFHPDEISFNKNLPPVVLTQFRLFDIPIPGKHEAEEITLFYNENFFSFEFAALNFTNSHKNQYAYMLENFDEDWVYSGTRRYASYTNLDPGAYTFRVKGSNNDGVWNEEGTSLRLIILPPWWRTWWAYSLYGLMAMATVLSIRHYELKRFKLRQRAAHLAEVDSLKSRFFANISHEFRTPLTLILGPLKALYEGTYTGNPHTAYGIMMRNGQRLLRLINQLLDISKLEAGKMRLQVRQTDVVLFLRHVASSYESLATDKKIRYLFCPQVDELILYIDQEKVATIVHNLLSNAFKFTAEGGEVILSLKAEAGQWAAISVKDTGKGIPEEEIPKVFDRFYQVDSSQTRAHEGSGLGMALARELAELHHGQIMVESRAGAGTTFTLKLPLNRSYPAAEKAVSRLNTEVKTTAVPTGNSRSGFAAATTQNGANVASSAPLLLLVEDHADLRAYIRMILQGHYQILEAANGREGVSMALEYLPDLVVADVMMPEMDGYQLCREVKTHELTAHIPVILLTARADRRSRLTGLETGADDYLSKPFDAEELQLIIRNRIEERRKMQERFSREITLQPAAVSISSLDEQFLQRVMAMIETHMDDPAFGVEAFSLEAGMSRMQLFRKLKALTGQAPGDFIRMMRLRRAADLLRQGAGNVAEVAFQVGFQDPSYFTKRFQKQFGTTPSEYLQQQRTGSQLT